MVVTCPNCRARYAVDPQKIGFAGRTVQCARCSHRWFEKVERPPAPAPVPTLGPAIDPPAAEPRPAPERVATAESPTAPESKADAETAEKPEVTASSESTPTPEPAPAPEPVPEMVIRPTTPGAALPAVIPPKVSVWRRVAIAAGVALLLVGGGVFAFRDQIEALLPADGPAPAAGTATAAATAPAKPAKPPAAQPRPQLEIDLAQSKIDVVDGRYVVRGEVVNHGTTAGSTSQLRVTFKRNDDVLGDKTFPLVLGPLAPEARANFSQVLEDPPPGTTDIVPVIE